MIIRCIIILISLLLGLITNNLRFNDLFLWGLGIRQGDMRGLENIEEMGRNNGIIVYNHPTFWDHSVLVQVLNRRIAFLAVKKHVNYPIIKQMCDMLGCIYVQDRDTVVSLKNAVDSGKLIAVAPAAGNSSENQYKLSKFKTGAFRASDIIYPVVIKYSPYERWPIDSSIGRAFLKRLQNDIITYDVVILPKMVRYDRESVEEFCNRVYDAMNNAIMTMIC